MNWNESGGDKMNKWLKCLVVLVISVSFICGSQHPVNAQEFSQKYVSFYDYYDKVSRNCDLYFLGDEPYIELNELAAITGYKLSQDGEKTAFIRKNGLKESKKVIVENNEIRYGGYRSEVNVTQYNEKTLISLLPTIDYLDSRIRMFDGRLCLFSLNYAFSDIVNDVVNDLKRSAWQVGEVTNIEEGFSKLELYLSMKVSSANESRNHKDVLISLMIEEDPNKVTLKKDDEFVEAFSAVDDILSLTGSDELKDLSFFDMKFGDLENTVSDYAAAEKALGKSVDVLENTISFKRQLNNFYDLNVYNVKNVILNEEVCSKSHPLYKAAKQLIAAYEDEDKKAWELTEEAVMNMIDAAAEMTIEHLLSAYPPVSLGLSAFEFFNDSFGVTDAASANLLQDDYHVLQQMVIAKLEEMNEQISKQRTLNQEEINQYVGLARLYYHIAEAYYHMMDRYVGEQDEFSSNYETLLEKVYRFDQYMNSSSGQQSYVFVIDDPSIEPTQLEGLVFEDKAIPQFDETPIGIKGKAYLAKVDGKYGVIDNQGNWIVEPKYDQYSYIYQTWCLANEGGNSEDYVSINDTLGIKGEPCTGYGGVHYGHIVSNKSDPNDVFFMVLGNGTKNIDKYIESTSVIVEPLKCDYEDISQYESELQAIDKESYYILNTRHQLFGPYDKVEIATYNYLGLIGGYYFSLNSGPMEFFNGSVSIYGLFYAKESGKYRIYDNTGTKSYPDLVDQVNILSNEAAEVTIGDKRGIINSDLELVVLGDYENVAEPIDGMTYAKVDGRWRLINV